MTKTGSTRCKQTLEVQCRRRIRHYQNRADTDGFGPVLSRQTFSLSNGDGTELRRDGDVRVSVNISI